MVSKVFKKTLGTDGVEGLSKTTLSTHGFESPSKTALGTNHIGNRWFPRHFKNLGGNPLCWKVFQKPLWGPMVVMAFQKQQ
jgi:hypothetical protein